MPSNRQQEYYTQPLLFWQEAFFDFFKKVSHDFFCIPRKETIDYQPLSSV